MMACFMLLSGAISQNDQPAQQNNTGWIAGTYRLSWELGLKACALYHVMDPTVANPLSNKSDKKKNSTKPLPEEQGQQPGE